jgi:hypothetical protein
VDPHGRSYSDIYAAIRDLGGDGFIQYKLVACGSAAVTALLIYRAARPIGSSFAAVVAACLYIPWLALTGGEGGQAQVAVAAANKNGAPFWRRRSLIPENRPGLGGLLLLDRRLAVGDGHNLDLAGLQRLGNAADELDMEQAVRKARRLDLDMVGKLEVALESATGDAAMQELGAFGLGLGLALNGQGIVLNGDVDVTLTETSDRHGNAVGILAELFDVVGRIGDGFGGLGGLDQPAEPVETDGRTE